MQEIYDQLLPVRRRQKLLRAVGYFGIGLVAAALAAVVLAVASSLLAMPVLRMVGWGVLAAAPILALMISQLSPQSWLGAAKAVDAHFHLDDRAASAITFLEQGKLTDMYALQINDTVACLAKLDTAAAVRLRLTTPLGIGAGWLLVATALLVFLPQSMQPRTTANGNSPTTSRTQSTERDEAAVPLPADVYWKPAVNGSTVLTVEQAGGRETAAFEEQASKSSELLDSRMNQRYRTNDSH